MPCMELKELEATYGAYAERRRVALPPIVERRTMLKGWLRTRAAYIMQVHRRSCAVCRIGSGS
jgi:hypothetical protein